MPIPISQDTAYFVIIGCQMQLTVFKRGLAVCGFTRCLGSQLNCVQHCNGSLCNENTGPGLVHNLSTMFEALSVFILVQQLKLMVLN